MRVIVLRDRWTGVSRTLVRPGESATGGSRGGTISADGRTVVFASSSTDLVDGPDANGSGDDVYRFDVPSATFSRVSLDTAGRQSSVGASFAPSVSADGKYVAFSSTAPLDGMAAPSRGPRRRSTSSCATSRCQLTTREVPVRRHVPERVQL